MTKVHEVTGLRVSRGKLYMTVDRERYVVELAAVSSRLAAASPQDQRPVEISPSGYGLHWPTVDEDLSVDGLIRWCEERGSGPKRTAANSRAHGS